MYSLLRFSADTGRRLVFIALAILIFVLIGLQFFRSSREGPGAQLYEQMVSLRLLNGQLAGSKTDFTTATFVANTRYEGHVRINLPPKQGFLSIVFFNYSDQLPIYMKYQCFSYPKEEIIFCDARFLDSFPDVAPIQLNKDDSPAPSLLFMWAIGHEIGHVVLRHTRPGILDLQSASVYEAWHERNVERELVPLKSLGALVSLGNSQENEADAFAIGQLRLNPTRAYQMALTLTDAALWLEDQYRNAARGSKDAPVLYISRRAHPPLLMRILALATQMEKTFVAFHSIPFIDDADISFQLRTAPATVAVNPSLLFGGFYRHITDSGLSPDEWHDLALYAFFRYGPDDFNLIREAFCKPIEYAPTGDTLCKQWSRADRQTGALSKPCASADEPALWACVREHVMAFLPCLSPSDVPAHEQCQLSILADSARRQLEQLDGHKFSSITKQWSALAHAEIFIQFYVAGQKTEVSDEDYSEYLLDKWGPGLTLRFIERLIGEYSIRHEADADKLAAFHSGARNLATELNAREDAIRHAAEVVRYSDKLSGRKAREVQAAARTELARLYLRAQNRIPSLGFEAYQQYVAKALPLFQQAVSLREKDWNDAKANHDSKAVLITLQQLVIASNDVIYSLVQVSQCEKALPFVAPLEQLIPSLDKDDLKLVALSFENVAAANVCAHKGDAAHAVDVATRAVSIREQFTETSDDKQRLMVAYFTLWEAAERDKNNDVCARAAGGFASLYELIRGRHIDLSFSTPIDGKLVSIEDCLLAYQSGEKH